MRRTWSLFLIVFLLFPVLGLSAQEEPPAEAPPESPPIESEWIDYNTNLYTRGDKTFLITLGVLFPTYFGGEDLDDPVLRNETKGMLSLGGTGSLSFNYFFTSHFFVGGELGGMFAGSRGGSMYYVIPFGVRAGFQFVFRRFEFPLSLMIGGAPQKFLESNYFGIIIKPGASVFWRFNPDWSFGLNTNWWFLPQWPKEGNTAYGNFLELTLSARYHF